MKLDSVPYLEERSTMSIGGVSSPNDPRVTTLGNSVTLIQYEAVERPNGKNLRMPVMESHSLGL